MKNSYSFFALTLLVWKVEAESLYGDDGFDRETLRRLVNDVDPTLGQSLSAQNSVGSSYLFYPADQMKYRMMSLT